jgi:hypothetical protein
MRRLAFALVVTFVVGGLGVARATPITLGAVNVITADHPASIWVRVPAPVTVDPWMSDDVSISGAGRFAGIAMADYRGSEGAMLIAIDNSYCATPGCVGTYTRDRIGMVSDPAVKGGWTSVLPAGDYLLHVISDGSPVSVTLRLAGLSGTTSVAPTGPSALAVKTLDQKLAAGTPPAQPVWSAAGTGHLGSHGGVIASNMWFTGKVHAVSDYGDCLYQGEPPFYAPRCPTATIAMDFINGFVMTDYAWGMDGFTTIWGGTWATQTWYAAAADVREVHGNAFWLSF